MNCPSCNNEVFPGDPFCDNCGADLRNMQAAPPPASPVAGMTVASAPPVVPVVPPPPVAPPAPSISQVVALGQPSAAPAPVADPVAAPLPIVTPPPFPAPPQPAAPLSPAAPIAPAGAGPRLVVKDTGAICPLPLGRDVIVGRTDPIDGIFPDVDLTPHDTLTGVSRRHARLHEQGGQWFIRDLNSTNYTIVNRQRLQPDQDFLIEPGDEIRFGRLTVVFQM